jgi:hypothetical protein
LLNAGLSNKRRADTKKLAITNTDDNLTISVPVFPTKSQIKLPKTNQQVTIVYPFLIF